MTKSWPKSHSVSWASFCLPFISLFFAAWRLTLAMSTLRGSPKPAVCKEIQVAIRRSPKSAVYGEVKVTVCGEVEPAAVRGSLKSASLSTVKPAGSNHRALGYGATPEILGASPYSRAPSWARSSQAPSRACSSNACSFRAPSSARSLFFISFSPLFPVLYKASVLLCSLCRFDVIAMDYVCWCLLKLLSSTPSCSCAYLQPRSMTVVWLCYRYRINVT